MSRTEPLIYDVTADTFDREVTERSHVVPVLVDFWAPWCSPCVQIAPALEQLTLESNGKFVLAKINTDENKVLAERFGIRHIPMVKLFVAGEAAGEFTGGLQVASAFGARMPATAVRAWVKTHISLNIHKKKWLLKLSSR